MARSPLNDQGVRRRARRPEGRLSGSRRMGGAAVALSAAAVLTGTALVVAAPVQAVPSNASSTHGSLSYAWQSTVNHKIHIRGYAFDNAHKSTSIEVGVYGDGNGIRTLTANRPSAKYDSLHGLSGGHVFEAVLPAPASLSHITVIAHPVSENGYRTIVSAPVYHHTPKGEKIVAVARDHLGANYVYGADGPNSFDCSGYAKFVYRKAGIADLPHNAEAQRDSSRVHRISHSSARPGDLVFYMSGGNAYHVAIYAGHGDQYSATNPSQGVEYDRIYDSNVIYGTTWH